MTIYGVRTSPYQNYQEYFTTEAGAENYIANSQMLDLYIEEIEVNK